MQCFEEPGILFVEGRKTDIGEIEIRLNLLSFFILRYNMLARACWCSKILMIIYALIYSWLLVSVHASGRMETRFNT